MPAPAAPPPLPPKPVAPPKPPKSRREIQMDRMFANVYGNKFR